ncbi:hypothetical protein [Polaribacter sp. KT25b]|nr:hypothetical protein [Polaribacter sp. KT25b]
MRSLQLAVKLQSTAFVNPPLAFIGFRFNFIATFSFVYAYAT